MYVTLTTHFRRNCIYSVIIFMLISQLFTSQRAARLFSRSSTTQGNRPNIACYTPGGGVLYIFWVRGRAIGKGIDFHDFGIRNGIDFHEFGIRNGITFRDFHNWYWIRYPFSENWYKVGYIFLKNWYKVGYTFWKNWYKERVCF